MKKFKERMAEKAGFTLVELIVVIAILGILAAVAVPAYSGYVKKADTAGDLMTLDAIKTATVACATMKGDDVAKIEVTATSGVISEVTYTSSASGATAQTVYSTTSGATVVGDFSTYIEGTTMTLTSKTFASGAQWPTTTGEGAIATTVLAWGAKTGG